MSDQPLVIAVGKPQGAVTFGDLADAFVLRVLQQGAHYERIDVVFDRYRDKTIKAGTRGRRNKTARRPNSSDNGGSISSSAKELGQLHGFN